MTYRALAARTVTGSKARSTFRPEAKSPARAGLMLGTALGVSIAIMAASPNQAWAADECGADIAGTVICTATSGVGNPYPAGIDYVADAGEDITVIVIGGGPITAVDVVTATDDGVTATGVYGYSATVTTYVGASIDAAYDGIQVVAGGDNAVVNNEAVIYAGEAGISGESTGLFGDTFITNSGNIYVDGDLSASTYAEGIYAESDETASVINSGYIGVYSSTDDYIFGIYADSDGAGYNAYVNSSGDIDVYNAYNDAQGIHAEADGAATVIMTGYTTVNANYDGTGIYAVSYNGDASVTAADIYVESSGGEAIGIDVSANQGAAYVSVVGDIYVDVDDITENNTGILIYGYDYAEVDVTGDIYVSDGYVATGIDAESYDGNVNIDVTGDIQVGDFAGTGATEYATGIDAYSYNGEVYIYVTGNVSAYGDEDAIGIDAESWNGYVYVDVDGDVTAVANDDDATGVSVYSYFGSAYLDVDGNVSATGYDQVYGVYGYADETLDLAVTGDVTATSTDGNAYGVDAYSFDGDVYVDVGGTVDVYGNGYATGIVAEAEYNVSVNVGGDVLVEAYNNDGIGVDAYAYDGFADVNVDGTVDVYGFGSATGIYAYGYDGVDIDVGGDVYVEGFFDDGVGIEAYSDDGVVSIYVAGVVDVYGFDYATGVDADGYYGVAVDVGSVNVEAVLEDGIGIVAGSDQGFVDVNVAGSVDVSGDDFAAGILAGGYDGVEIDVGGSIDVYADAGSAVGIGADSDDGFVDVYVAGAVEVYGYNFATGVYADGNDGVSIDVGSIDVYAYNYDAYGVQAISDNGDVDVYVAGNVDVFGDNYGTGIYAYADGDAYVEVGGNVYVTGYNDDGIGVVAFADGGYADVDIGGTTGVYGYDYAYGVAAIGFLGADVDTGSVYVFAQNEDATGIFAYGLAGDADVTVTGNMYVEGQYDATGVQAVSIFGDASVDVTGEVDVFAANEDGLGLYAASTFYDASVTLTGDLYVYGENNAAGIVALAYYDATVDVTGNIDVYAYFDDGVGIFASSIDGYAQVDVAGNVDVYGYDYATGIVANGDTASVVMTGDMDVFAQLESAYGITMATDGDAYVSFTGNMDVDGETYAYGINVDSTLGNVTVYVDGSLDVYAYDNFASAIDIYAEYDIYVSATGSITAESYNASAWGVFATSYDGYADINVENVYVTSTNAGGAGVQVYGYDGVSVVASGQISTYGDNIEGVDANSVFGDVYVSVNNVYTDGFSSEGVDGYSVFGDTTVVASGDVTTMGDSAEGLLAVSIYGYASASSSDSVTTYGADSDGVEAVSIFNDAFATSTGDVYTGGYSANGVSAYSAFGDAYAYNGEGTITTVGDFSYGLAAESYAGDATATNNGTILTYGEGSHGIFAYAYNGVATVDNFDGHVETSGDYAAGIYAYGYAGVNVTNGSYTVITSGYSAVGIFGFSLDGYVYIDSGTVMTTGDASDGIVGVSLGADLAYDYVTIYSDLVTTDGLGSDGIVAYTYNGQITIDSGTITTLGDDSYGIFAYANNDGSIDIESDYIETSGANSFGIYAYAFLGTSTVDSYDVETHGYGSIGIYNYGFTGAYVESSFVQTDGDFSAGIVNLAYYGLATVDSFDVDTYGDYSPGIVSVGFSGSYVESSYVYTGGNYSDGIVSVSTGGSLASVDSFSVFTTGDYSDGIVAVGYAYYDSGTTTAYGGSAYVDSTFVTTTGYNAYGIVAQAQGGDVDVFSYSVATYGDFSTGIYAAAFSYYDSGNLLNLTGDVYVNSAFVFTSGFGSTGIDTYNRGGDIDIFSNSVVTTGDFATGIQAYAAYYLDPVLLTYYSGDVFISSNEVYTYGDYSDGINAYAAGGDVDIFANDVGVYGLGSDAIYAGTGGLDASNSDDVEVYTYGTIYSFDGRGIAVNSAGSSYVYVGGSVYGYDWAIQSYSVDGTVIENDGLIYGGEGRAIDVDGGAAYIDNDGTIWGFVDLTDNADFIENDNYWGAYGTSSFGAGVDEVDNDGIVSFSRDTGAPEITYMTGLEYFDNYGIVTGTDAQVGDSLNISGNFHGGAGSELELDVELGGPGSIADTLVIGSASGVTEILPFDQLAGDPGVLNFGGILVVNSANAAEAGTEFVMDNVDKGWVEYELFFDAANDNWLIVGLPDDEVFELLGAMSGAQDFWRRSGDAMTARWQEMRDANPHGSMATGPGGMGRSEGWELWMQAHGGDEGFDSEVTFDIGGFTFVQDLDTNTDWRGFQFGFDNMSGNTVWGLTMGFVQQETRFEFDQNSFDFEGWNVGAYAGWASGGFFLNGLLKGDFYEVDGNFHTLPSLFSFDGVTWGVKGELGYRWEGEQMFFEPVGSLEWTNTDLDGFTSAGASVAFDDADSLRGKLGARLGGTFGTGEVVLTPYIGAHWVSEMDGDNTLSFTSGPTTISFSDEEREDYGQLEFGITMQTFYGLEGFVKGEWNFSGDADGGAARLGARWRW